MATVPKATVKRPKRVSMEMEVFMLLKVRLGCIRLSVRELILWLR